VFLLLICFLVFLFTTKSSFYSSFQGHKITWKKGPDGWVLMLLCRYRNHQKSKVLHGYFIMEERNDDLWIFFMPLVRFSRAPIPKSRGQSSSWRRRTKYHSFTLHYLHFSVPLKIRKWIKTNHDKRMWVSEVKHELFLFPLYFVIFEYK